MDLRRLYPAAQTSAVGISRLRSTRDSFAPSREARDPKIRVSISKRAELMSNLSSIKRSDVSQLEELMETVGRHFKAAANPQSGAVGQELGALADRLLTVAKTGNLGPLQSVDARVFPGPVGRAVHAYRRHVPGQLSASRTLDQALDYVREAARAVVR